MVSSAYTQALEDDLEGVNSASRSQFSSARGALAASKNEDDFLLTMLRLRGLDTEC